MSTVCPKHHVPLKIKKMRFDQMATEAYVGICPQCQERYIDKCFFKSVNSFKYEGIQYKFLETMGKETAILYKEEQRRVKMEEEALRQKLKRQKKAEERAKKHQKFIEAKVAEMPTRRESYMNNAGKTFRPIFVAYYENLPTKCPLDGESLLYLRRVLYHREMPGVCCLCCERLFLPRKGVEPPTEEDILQALEAQPAVTHARESLDRLPKQEKNKGSFRPNRADKISFTVNQTKTSEKIKQVKPEKGLPTSTVVIAEILSERGGKRTIIDIVSKKEQADRSKNIYWVGQPLAAAIIGALNTHSERRFLCEGIRYRIISFRKFENAEKYQAAIGRFSDGKTPQTVFVYSHKQIKTFEAGDYECVTAMVPCQRFDYLVPVTVYYDKKRQRYFMNEVTYTDTLLRYGLPYLRVQLYSTETDIYRNSHSLNAHSELNLLGYSVSASEGLSITQRQELLARIIDSRIMSKTEIINHIEWLIRTRKHIPRMLNAVAEWQADLRFVNGYRMDHQRSICVGRFISKMR